MLSKFSSAHLPSVLLFSVMSVQTYIYILPFLKLGCLFLCVEFSEFFIYFGCNLLSHMCFTNIFYHLSFQSLSVFYRAENFNFNSHLSVFLSSLVFFLLYLKSHFQKQGHLSFPPCCFLSIIVLCFTFRFVIHFEQIFGKDIRARFILTIFCCCCYGCPVVQAPQNFFFGPCLEP